VNTGGAPATNPSYPFAWDDPLSRDNYDFLIPDAMTAPPGGYSFHKKPDFMKYGPSYPLRQSNWLQKLAVCALVPSALAHNLGTGVKILTYGAGTVAGGGGYAVVQIPMSSDFSMPQQVM
jgi:hypothetical protein